MNKENKMRSLLFEGLHEEQIQEFFANFPEKKLIEKNTILCRQNEVGDTMFLLESGKLEILITDGVNENENNLIAVIEGGAVIGEMCVFGERKRSATIRASEDSKLISIEGAIFRNHVAEKKIWALLISFNIAKILSLRLAKANEFIYKLYKKSTLNASDTHSELETYRKRFFDESLFN